jgi:hypothetical protein
MNSRRQFIQRFSGALFGAAAVPVSGLAVSAAPRTTFTAFLGQLNTEFVLTTAAGKVLPVVLEKAEPFLIRKRPELADHRNFSLKFASQTTQPMEQGTYTLQHPKLGKLDLFFVPNVSDATGQVNFFATFHGSPVTV